MVKRKGDQPIRVSGRNYPHGISIRDLSDKWKSHLFDGRGRHYGKRRKKKEVK